MAVVVQAEARGEQKAEGWLEREPQVNSKTAVTAIVKAHVARMLFSCHECNQCAGPMGWHARCSRHSADSGEPDWTYRVCQLEVIHLVSTFRSGLLGAHLGRGQTRTQQQQEKLSVY